MESGSGLGQFDRCLHAFASNTGNQHFFRCCGLGSHAQHIARFSIVKRRSLTG